MIITPETKIVWERAKRSKCRLMVNHKQRNRNIKGSCILEVISGRVDIERVLMQRRPGFDYRSGQTYKNWYSQLS